MRTAFIGTGDIAIPSFRWLLASAHPPLVLVTQPDRPAGRGLRACAPRMKSVAQEAGVPVLQPEKIGAAAGQLADLEPDLVVVMAYGQILPPAVLAIARVATVNLHASLLPRHRGASCIQAAIDQGDPVTGVTAMHVVRELDAGDVICARSLPINADETGGSLHDRLADLATGVLSDAMILFQSGDPPRLPQDAGRATFAPKLGRDDGRIDWRLPAERIARRVRAYHPWPGTFTMAEGGGKMRRVKIQPPVRVTDDPLPPGRILAKDGAVLAGCGEGSLRLGIVQAEGGRPMEASEWLRGTDAAGFS